jgi:Holliday junction DNA helicase RuvA
MMIAHVRGELIRAEADAAIVDCGGVGYRCLIPTSTRNRLPPPGSQVLLHTSFQVREDALTLYGFLTPEELGFFELLLRVDGVGPKVALALLSTLTPEQARRSIVLEDVTALCRVPGVGKKTAQRIVLELKEKVGSLSGGSIPVIDLHAGVAAAPAGDLVAETIEALQALGYSRTEATEALARARKEAPEGADVALLVRLSLKQLYRG